MSFLWLWALIFLAVSTPVSVNPSPSEVIDLTLQDAIRLALERNRSFLNYRLDRELERFALESAEDRWAPRFAVRPFTHADRQDYQAGIGVEANLRVPTGGEFVLRWDETLSQEVADPSTSSGGSQVLNFSQPLLKGAWTGIDTASVRQTRLEEKASILALRQAAADLIVAVIGSYRALIGAIRQVEIGEASLRRSREQLKATRALIHAGRVARREAVRSEAAVANRELSLAQARNRLDAASFRLIDILELRSTVRVRPLGELRVDHTQVGLAPTMEEALLSRADFLQAMLRVDIARIKLAVAQNNLLPDLSVKLQLSQDDTRQTDALVGLEATISLNDPLPELEHLRTRTELQKAEMSLVELRESIGIAVRQAVNDVEVRLRLTELARGARQLAEENLAVERKKFGQGLSSSFQVSASEDDLLRAEQTEVEMILAYQNALTRLNWISGKTLDRWGIRLEDVPE